MIENEESFGIFLYIFIQATKVLWYSSLHGTIIKKYYLFWKWQIIIFTYVCNMCS